MVCSLNVFDVANWHRRPSPGTIFHSNHRSKYVAWDFRRRLREAELPASMEDVDDALDDAAAESFLASIPSSSTAVWSETIGCNSRKRASNESRFPTTVSGVTRRATTRPLLLRQKPSDHSHGRGLTARSDRGLNRRNFRGHQDQPGGLQASEIQPITG